MDKIITIEVSARHIHLSQKDLEALFGKDYELGKLRDLTQSGDFAAEEILTIKNKEKEIKNVRIVGPKRDKTQVELSLTDFYSLSLEPIFKVSGDLNETSGIMLINEKNKKQIKITSGVIIPLRHIHCNSSQAEELGIKDKDVVSVKTQGQRAITFHNVIVRIKNDYKLCAHLDTDEGNAAGIEKTGIGEIIL